MTKRASNCKYAENRYTASEKQICLITLLADKRWHLVSVLAEQFNTTVRSILRDLEKIKSLAHVNIERENVTHNTDTEGEDVWSKKALRVRIVPKYRFKGIESGMNESINLILAVAYSTQIGFSLMQVAKTLEKLHAMLPPELASQVDWFRTRFHFDIPAHTNGLKYLELIRKAICETRRIKMSHTSVSNGVTDSHEINPYGLIYYHDKWYLIGFDYNHAEMRVFRIDRFNTCEMLKSKFTPPDDFDAQKHWYTVFWKQYGKNAETFVLEFAPEYAERVKSWDSIERKDLPGGKLRATFKAMNPEWVKGFVLSCGRYCMVKEPAWLRDVVAKEAGEIVGLY